MTTVKNDLDTFDKNVQQMKVINAVPGRDGIP